MDETTRGSARRRRRAPRQSSAPAPASAPASDESPEPTPGSQQTKPQRRRPRDAEGGLRELVGGGKSQLGVDKALRGRDVNRPTEADLEAAERDIVLVRRHWTPPPAS